MQIPWQDLSYLRDGNQRQREAFRALHSLGILEVLHDYSPILVGTIPIGIDVEASDLDIACEAHDLDRFARHVIEACGRREGFQIKQKRIKGVPTVVASLLHGGFRIEIFGQPQSVAEQQAYRHMVIEALLLGFGGEKARREIQQLKRDGLKTEPAFALFFGLEGDPYEVLLELSRLDGEELRRQVRDAHRTKQCER